VGTAENCPAFESCGHCPTALTAQFPGLDPQSFSAFDKGLGFPWKAEQFHPSF